MEQQRRHAEAKRELLASRYFKMPAVGFPPAALGPPQFRASLVDHARLIVQLCPPTSSLLQPLDQDTLDRFCVHLSRLHFPLCICLRRHHSLHFLRIAGVDQGRGTLTAAKSISRLTMWEVVLFLTVSSNSGALSLDSAVHRIVAHVKRRVVLFVHIF